MTPRGRRTLPLPIRAVLDKQCDASQNDVRWLRVQRALRGRSGENDAKPAVVLPVPVARVLREEEHPSLLRAKHQALRQRRARQRHANPVFAWTKAALLLALFAVLFLRLRPASELAPKASLQAPASPRADQLMPLPEALEAQAESIEMLLPDASQIRVAPHSRLVALASTPTRLDFLLETGEADFSVTPNGPQRWTIEAGIARVEVVGTVFKVARHGPEVRVSVSRGAVLVKSQYLAHGVARLTAGDTLTLAPEARGEAQPIAPSTAPNAPDTGAVKSAQGVPSSGHKGRGGASASTNAGGTWQSAFAAGRFADAYELLGDAEFAQQVANATTPAQLLTLADLARLSGHPAQSVSALHRLTEHFARSPQASLAAFTLGRVYADQLGDAVAASQAFELAIALQVPQAVREDCHARLVRAYLASGKRAAAARAAKHYLALFPSGRHAREFANHQDAE